MTVTAAPRATGTAAERKPCYCRLRGPITSGRTGDPAACGAVLDLSGEDIRKSLYLTADASGEECASPRSHDSVARDYLASSRAASPRDSAISGRCSVIAAIDRANFCRPASNPSVGRSRAADAEMLGLALEAAAAFGLTDVEIRTGTSRCSMP